MLVEELQKAHKSLKRNQKALQYLYNRGFDDESIKEFQIGFVTKRGKWEDLEDLKERIVIPLTLEGEPFSAIGRRIDEHTHEKYRIANKYLFTKANYLFNFDKSTIERRRLGTVYIVEGVFDAIALWMKGYAVVATLGSLLSKQQLYKLKHYFPNVVLAFDGDEAGLKAMLNFYRYYKDELAYALPDGDEDYGNNKAIPRIVSIEEIATQYYIKRHGDMPQIYKKLIVNTLVYGTFLPRT